MTDAHVRIRDLRFGYINGPFRMEFDAIDIRRGEQVACIGPSGTGKSTLVNLIAGILVPDAGVVQLGDVEMSALGDDDRRAQRIARIGMVFQEFELLEYLTALDNVLLPFRIARDLRVDADARAFANSLATTMAIDHVLTRRPSGLSQGERQRVAICRALVTRPELVICDEPTGNLDPDTAALTLDLLFEQVRERDATLLMVTHDHAILGRFDRVIDMRELGVVVTR